MSVNPNISDGFHSFKELYEHRIALFKVILFIYPQLAWKSLLHHDNTSSEGWFLVCLELPYELGQVSYHFPISEWDLLPYIKILDKAKEWDGHETMISF